MAQVLGPDMLTIIEDPVRVIPSGPYGAGTSLKDLSF